MASVTKLRSAGKRTPTAEDARLTQILEEARTARSVFATTYNNFYSMAAPWRPRVGERSTPSNPRAPSEQDDIFDTTLQDAVDDWASDCGDEFTPSYRPWTTYTGMTSLEQFSKPTQEKIKALAQSQMNTVYDSINASSYEEQSQEAWTDLAIGPTGMDIPYTAPGLPLSFEHVPLAELLFVPSPYGGIGDRAREREIQVKHLDVMYPNIDWSHLGTKEVRRMTTTTVTITEMHTRDWYNRSEEVWTFVVMEGGMTVSKPQVTRGDGSCRLIIARPRVSAPSAYGIGFANKAIAPSRALDQMAYLALKREGRALDPPTIYSDPEQTLNVEGGMDNGVWYEAGDGFEVKEIYPQSDAREVWFKQEDLRAMVRRALFQDKPYQRGDTPPSATQWMQEEERNARRKGFPRARITNEWVLPILRRVTHILKERKQIEDFDFEGKLIRFEPISPMSRASDLNEVTMADRHITMFAGRFGEEAIDYYDVPEMMENARKKMGTTVVVVETAEKVAEKQQRRAMMQAAASGKLMPGDQAA